MASWYKRSCTKLDVSELADAVQVCMLLEIRARYLRLPQTYVPTAVHGEAARRRSAVALRAYSAQPFLESVNIGHAPGRCKDVPQGMGQIAHVSHHNLDRCGPLVTSILQPPLARRCMRSSPSNLLKGRCNCQTLFFFCSLSEA